MHAHKYDPKPTVMVHITALGAAFRPAPPPGFPGATLQLLHSKHFLNTSGNHHASVTVRNLEDVGGSDFKLDPDSERSIEC